MRITRWNSLALGLTAAVAASCDLVWPAQESPYLQSYFDAHFQELGTGFVKALTRAEFLEQLRRTRVLYLGDHHRDPQLHAHMLELLDWICAQGMRPVIGMEALGSQDNPSLQEFLSGGIEFPELRRRIARRWPQSWLDHPDIDHGFFRDLLQRARRHRLEAFPLEPTPRHALGLRDGIIATNVRRALRLHPDQLIVVIVGHAHVLGDGHLRGRIGAPSLTIAARCSPSLARALTEHPPVGEGEFLRTDRGVLFFPDSNAERISDE